jgi:hypothetical protein
VSAGTAGVDGVRRFVELVENNIRTDLEAIQEIIEIDSRSALLSW